MLSIEEFLPIYADAKKDKDVGQLDDFVEVLRLYDKDGNGLIPSNQLTHLLMGYGNSITLTIFPVQNQFQISLSKECIL